MLIYAIGDTHGCKKELDEALSKIDLSAENKNILICLGDYIHRGEDDIGVLKTLFSLQDSLGKDRVILLKGNHELLAVENSFPLKVDTDDKTRSEILKRLNSLPLFYHHKQSDTVFVHGGLNEDSREKALKPSETYMLWQDYEYKSRAPFNRVICGHTQTSRITGIPSYTDVYCENNHYYIDGGCYLTGVLNVVAVYSDTGAVFKVSDKGLQLITPAF